MAVPRQLTRERAAYALSGFLVGALLVTVTVPRAHPGSHAHAVRPRPARPPRSSAARDPSIHSLLPAEPGESGGQAGGWRAAEGPGAGGFGHLKPKNR